MYLPKLMAKHGLKIRCCLCQERHKVRHRLLQRDAPRPHDGWLLLLLLLLLQATEGCCHRGGEKSTLPNTVQRDPR